MAPLLIVGAAIGGAAMYFLDPEKGRGRRARVRDQAVKTTGDVRQFVDSGKRDLMHRGSIVAGRLRSRFKPSDASDEVLVERIRSRMGRHVAHPGAVEVVASGGHVTLTGTIFAHEREALVEALGDVPGVSDIFDELTVYETAEDISELHDDRDGDGKAHEDWAPATRLVTGAAGTTLTLYALVRRSRFAGFVALATGVALLARTATNKPLSKLAGIRGGYQGIDIQKSIHIDAPVDEVFVFLADYDNYPTFMRNVLSVETFPDGRSHWKIAGPAGVEVEWDAITTRVETNELIQWSTIVGSTVEHAGAIDLEPAGEGTRVRIEMSYNPPAGVLGHAIAKLFGADPKAALDEDMMRLKSTLETGRLPRDAAAAL
ncbi:MAG TPA: SRPBCC family protein [Burkholderiales bacterium]|nr:SRPBCC family protein [Burkholderiales bacterium]